ncbi:MAG: hypothetical protein HW416_1065 [Chloroflexi bacterium]|nr:hypothetical protein [Chloroflexota bacterium]
MAPISHASNWSNATRVTYRVQHSYRYTYSAPVRALRQRLIMIPSDSLCDQRLLDYQLAVDGTNGSPEIDWGSDVFGNRVCTVRGDAVPNAISFDVSFSVERTTPQKRTVRLSAREIDAYMSATPLTQTDERLDDAARGISSKSPSPEQRASMAAAWTTGALAYQNGVTSVGTTAADALRSGKGVCQDFSHVLLALLRRMDIPARYVSGHLIGDGAPHAWVEALLPRGESAKTVDVAAYDAANDRQPGLDYVAVAVGRDYADVSPTSGWFTGSARSTLDWTKCAEVTAVDRSTGDAAS